MILNTDTNWNELSNAGFQVVIRQERWQSDPANSCPTVSFDRRDDVQIRNTSRNWQRLQRRHQIDATVQRILCTASLLTGAGLALIVVLIG